MQYDMSLLNPVLFIVWMMVMGMSYLLYVTLSKVFGWLPLPIRVFIWAIHIAGSAFVSFLIYSLRYTGA